MPRNPDTPCADCGRLLWSSATSLPSGDRKCRECRRGCRPLTRECPACHVDYRPKASRHNEAGYTLTCSKRCARMFERPRVTAACEWCGEAFTRRASELGRFCSSRCYGAQLSDAAAKRRAANAPGESCRIYVSSCDRCSEAFTARTAHAKYCSDPCRKAPAPPRACRDCDSPVDVGKTLCADCKAAATKAARRRYRAWRRAKEKGAAGAALDPLTVYERDGWRCGICKRQISKRLTYPHPRSVSLDHIVPLSWGGEHVWENVQPAHLECNMTKSNRVEFEQPLLLA